MFFRAPNSQPPSLAPTTFLATYSRCLSILSTNIGGIAKLRRFLWARSRCLKQTMAYTESMHLIFNYDSLPFRESITAQYSGANNQQQVTTDKGLH